MTHITHEQDGLIVVARERTGRDEVDAPYIDGVIAGVIAKRQGLKDITALPNRVWLGISTVTPLIQQIVSLDGDWPFTLPVSESGEALCAFHDAVLDAPKRYLAILQAAVEKADTPVPNPPAAKPESTGNVASDDPLKVAS